jgi:hypothetical protein
MFRLFSRQCCSSVSGTGTSFAPISPVLVNLTIFTGRILGPPDHVCSHCVFRQRSLINRSFSLTRVLHSILCCRVLLNIRRAAKGLPSAPRSLSTWRAATGMVHSYDPERTGNTDVLDIQQDRELNWHRSEEDQGGEIPLAVRTVGGSKGPNTMEAVSDSRT